METLTYSNGIKAILPGPVEIRLLETIRQFAGHGIAYFSNRLGCIVIDAGRVPEAKGTKKLDAKLNSSITAAVVLTASAGVPTAIYHPIAGMWHHLCRIDTAIRAGRQTGDAE